MDKDIKKAQQIAIRDLRACYGTHGIRAGLHHFSDYWARDSFFSCIGALAIGDKEIAQRTFNTFKKYQLQDGQIPLRFGAQNFLLKYIGFRTAEKPVFGEDKHGNSVIDSSLLYIIVAGSIYLGGKKDAKKILKSLELAHQWARKNSDDDILLKEREYSGWMDSVKKRGFTLYTNLLYWKATITLSELCINCGEKTKAANYKSLGLKIFNKINEEFWNGKYFSDWIGDKRYDFCPTGEQFLSIYWNFATNKQATKMLQHVENAQDDELCYPVYPAYPNKYCSPFLQLVGMGDYHTKLRWLWICCAQAMAHQKIGNNRIALHIIKDVARLINKHDAIYEVYNSSNKPIRRLFYRSEVPFAWSCSFFILAVKQMSLKE